jgi:hypothetical protein
MGKDACARSWGWVLAGILSILFHSQISIENFSSRTGGRRSGPRAADRDRLCRRCQRALSEAAGHGRFAGGPGRPGLARSPQRSFCACGLRARNVSPRTQHVVPKLGHRQWGPGSVNGGRSESDRWFDDEMVTSHSILICTDNDLSFPMMHTHTLSYPFRFLPIRRSTITHSACVPRALCAFRGTNATRVPTGSRVRFSGDGIRKF